MDAPKDLDFAGAHDHLQTSLSYANAIHCIFNSPARVNFSRNIEMERAHNVHGVGPQECVCLAASALHEQRTNHPFYLGV